MLVGFFIGFMLALVVILAVACRKLTALYKATQTAWLKLDSRLKNRGELLPLLALSAAAWPEVDRALIYALKNLREDCRQANTLPRRIAGEKEVTCKLKHRPATRPAVHQTATHPYFGGTPCRKSQTPL